MEARRRSRLTRHRPAYESWEIVTPDPFPWQTSPPRKALDWMAACVGGGATVRSVRRMGAGIAQSTHAVTIDDASGERHRVVLQRWIRPGWDTDDPGFHPAKEAAVLRALLATAIPAPVLVAVDRDGTQAGAPAIVVERLPGEPPSDAKVRRRQILRALGETLAVLHREGPPAGALSRLESEVPAYMPFGDLADATSPPASRRPDLWRAAIEEAARPGPAATGTLIHRDFHPGNTLWIGDRLTGVVDWTSASWGPPAADLAHLRVDLVHRVGPDEADVARDAFARAGGDLSGARHHDLRTLFGYLTGRGTDALVQPFLGRFEDFLVRVLDGRG